MTPPLVTLVMLVCCVPLWWAGGWVVEVFALWPIDLIVRAALVLLFLNLVGEALDRRLH